MKLSLLAIFAAGLLAACAAPSAPTPVPTPVPSATASPQPSATFTLAPTPTETSVPISPICSPLQGHSFQALKGYISQGFSAPQGTTNWDGGHHGLDFAYYQRNDEGGVGGHINGTPIQSVFDGYVAALGFAPTYGNYLIIETPADRLPPGLAVLFPVENGESLYLLYAHMQELAPFVLSEPMDCGQVIGAVGDTGDEYFIAEPHLHFETRVGVSNIRLADMNYYDTQATDEEKAEYRHWRNSDAFQLFDPMLLLDYGVEHEDGNG
ncbi:MAG: M23 family metallopeptidase [Chloroflexi bacterium]|nr:M23 family metallopeptidase [Chloroflexota bacterium]